MKVLTAQLYGTDNTDGKFKKYQSEQAPKVVDLGLSISIKDLNKNITGMGTTEITVPVISSSSMNFAIPTSLPIDPINIVTFNPSTPVISTINFNPIPVLSLNGTGGGNGGITGFFPYGDQSGNNSIISQMDLTSGTITVKTARQATSNPGDWNYDDPGYYSYTLDNVVGAPSVGLTYYMINEYDPITSTWINVPAVLPTGVYTDSIQGNPAGYSNSVQGVLKVIDNPLTRIGVNGSNPDNLKIILEGDVPDARFLEQVLHYDEHYSGMYDPIDSMWKQYTLDDMETRGWITASEKAELGSKFLDTTLGHTTANRYFQFVENNGAWYLKGSNVVGVNIQAHSGGQNANSIFTNRGTIIGLNESSSTNNLLGKQVAFMFTEGQSSVKQEGFDNTGRIEMRAPQSVIYLMTNNASSGGYDKYTDANGNVTETTGEGKHFLMNSGDIKLYGNNNIGVYTNNAQQEYHYNYQYTYTNPAWNSKSEGVNGGLNRSEIRLNNPLTVLGDESIGIDIERTLNFANSKIKVDVGTEDPRQNVASITGYNGLENSGNVAGGNALYTDSSAGIYVNMTGNIIQNNINIYDQINPANNYNSSTQDIYSPQFTLSDYALNVGSYSRGGAGIRVEEYGDVVLGSSSDASTSHEINLLSGGSNNAGIYISGSNAQVTTDGMNLNIDGTTQVGSQIENNGKFYHNNGTITVNGTNNTGIAVKTAGYAELNNTGVVNVGAHNLGIYNNETFNMNGGTVKADGLASVGVYSEAGNTKTTLSGGTVRAENGGIGLYSGTGSLMNLNQGVNLQAGNKGLLFFNYDSSGTLGKYNVTGTVGATVENGGNAFYVKGGTLSSYLTNSFTGTGKVDLTMHSGSKLYILEGKGTTVNLTTLDSMVAPGAILSANVEINPASASDYIPIAMDKGTLELNRNVNLDNANDVYKRSEFSSVAVTLDSGMTLSGTGSNQLGIAQKNYAGTSGIDEIKITNNGTIDLSGTKSVGIVSDYGHIVNNNVLKTTGAGSIGIVTANGTLTENNGEVVIGGQDTAGIYGVNSLNGTPSSVLGYGNDSINIVNNGKVTSTGSDKVYGIYVDNTAGSSSTLTLGTGSDINVSSSNGGVGIYANGTTVTGGGSLTVGTNGLGMYAKDSNVNLSGLTMNLNGNNILGFYLDGTTNFAGTGNINVNGQNIALFNILSNGTFTNNFNITSTAGSSYAVGTIKNGTFYYNGTANLSSNGSMLSGSNSSVLMDTASVINSGDSSVVGVSLDGQYTGSVPSGFTAGIEGENRGTISLTGNNSAGLYGANGVRYLNSGSIVTGNESMGIRTSGAGSSIVNNGTIQTGSGSQGMYGEESSLLSNNGTILSTGSKTAGIYGESTGAMIVSNTGMIDLQGDKSIGMYTKGTGAKTITNSGTVKTGSSSDLSEPSIGIYSDNATDIITNTGTVAVGSGSAGIYGKGNTISQQGIITTGDSGTGIYTDAGTVTLSTGSALTTGSNNAVGVYGINGASITNDGTTNVGDGSFGYGLKSGSNLVNNGASTLGNNGVFVYGDGAGNISGSSAATITMTGSNNIGYYTINGGNIQNDAAITGTTGTANVGIYNQGGSINNTGNISVGDSVIVDKMDSTKNSYAVGIYGEGSVIKNTGDISVGYYGIGLYSKKAPVAAENYGNITSNAEGAIGVFAENSEVRNYGNVTMNGSESMGIYANKGSKVVNLGTVTMNGDSSTGVYLNINSTLDNQGIININGNDSTGVMLKGGSTLLNTGTLNISGTVTGSRDIVYGGTEYPVPSIINAGVVKVSENFETKGIDISIKVDPSTITAPTTVADAGAQFVSNAVKFYAPSFTTQEPIGILSGFTSGTHAEVYKFEDVFNPMTEDEGGPNSGLVKVKSKSLTWSATPVLNNSGNVDIWMQKIPYDNFTSGLWYEDFGKALDTKYVGSQGKAGEIFDKIDTIETEYDFRKTMSGLSGEMYSNINQREETIGNVFEDSLKLLKDSKNNTKENVKINVIAGKGKLSEDTEGVLDYDYETAGVLALREVERTYKHTFGYSLGYAHTSFEFKDGYESEEWADTVEAGVHSKYVDNGWKLMNDLTGRVSFHNTDRNLDWTNVGRSEMNGTYEVYSIASDNILGKELSIGKNASIMPYGGIKAEYMTRPGFSESGLEALEVEGNDAWSIKPKAGVELKGNVPLGKSDSWKLKGALDLRYEYELGDLNEREYARLTAVEEDYHKLAKPEEEKGKFKAGAILGVETEDRYGVFLTGDYSVGGTDQDEYRAGMTFKAVF